MLKVYAYKGCSTCRNAVKWLTARQLPFAEIAIREQPPTPAELAQVLHQRGGEIRALFNTSGLDYRTEAWKDKLPQLAEADALAALAANGNLIKRPLIIDTERGIALNGFKEAEWAACLG
jgi:arsenate reductase (glutaredoxin)